jgi:hypothetical protein
LSGEKGGRVTPSTPQASPEAAHFDARPVGVLLAGCAVTAPAVGEVEALGDLVAAQHPEDGLAITARFEAAAGILEQLAADARAPMLGIDVEGVDLTGAFGVRVARGSEGGEADDPPAGEGDDRLRIGGSGGVEVIPPDPLLRLQRVEDLVVDQAPVGDLPGADVDARDVKTLVCPGGSD